MSKSESDIAREFRKTLIDHEGYRDFSFWGETSERKDVYSLFENASKEGNGNRGKADIIGISKDDSILVLVEVKKHTSDHCSKDHILKEHADPRKDIVDKKKHACSGVRWYMKACLTSLETNTLKHKVKLIIGIAVSGNNNENITIYACNLPQTGFSFVPRFIGYELVGSDTIERRAGYFSSFCLQSIQCGDRLLLSLDTDMLHQINFTEAIFQRPVDLNYVSKIVDKFMERIKESQDIPVTASIIVGELNGAFYLIDGQHRVAAYKVLLTRYKETFEVPIIVKTYINEEMMKADFLVHNAHSPLTDTEKEHALKPSLEGKKELANGNTILVDIQKLYPGAIADKKRYLARMCERDVKEYIQSSIVSGITRDKSNDEIVEYIKNFNLITEVKYQTLEASDRNTKFAKKCRQLNCWLGYQRDLNWFK